MAPLEIQIAAWEAYRRAKLQSDATGDFFDARTAADAWVAFLNAYLDDDHKLPTKRSANVTPFPVHRTRPGGASLGVEA